MSKLQAGKFSGFLVVFLFLIFFVNSADAQTVSPRKKAGKAAQTEAMRNAKPAASKKSTAAAKPAAVKSRLPVIIIPGLIGSELINKATSERVWFRLGRSSSDDLRLPISPDIKANKDNLTAGDMLRKIKIFKFAPEVRVYDKLVNVLQDDGFKEGKFDKPEDGGDADTFYVFSYDWRLDNVENAQLLLKKLDALRVRYKRPNLKFNIIAHSMGGLIARYAAMYGSADLTAQSPRSTWKGANYFNTISLVATPNAGAATSLNSLLNGFSLFGNGKINLPFIQSLSRFDLFTIPSIYQLLPHDGRLRAFDEKLQPIKVDIYDPATWEKYGWAAYTKPEFTKKLDGATPEQGKAYFEAVLGRAKLFQAALDAKPAFKSPFPTFYLGAGCKQTIDGLILRQDKDGAWKTDFGSPSYTRSDGVKMSSKETKKSLLSSGDGVVPKTSLLFSYTNFGKLRNSRTKAVINELTDSCDEHNRLTGNVKVDQVLLNVLNNKPIEVEQPAAPVGENK